MRIGIEITPLTHTPTGVGYYVRHLLEALTRTPEAHTLRGFASGIHPLDTDHIPIWYMRLPIPTRLLYRLWDSIEFPRVDRMLRGVDVYHAVNYVLPPVKEARRVLSIYDLSFLRYPEWSSPKVIAPFQRSIRRHARDADAVIACSEATRRDIIEMLDVAPERIRVIHAAADALFQPMEPEMAMGRLRAALGLETPFLLYVGTIEPRKNVTGLIEAYAGADVPQRLVIAGGKGWGCNDLPELVARLGLEERIMFTGYLQDRALFPALYSAADAMIFPSRYEGFGLPVLEAMACGCPVVTSDSSSLPEVGGDAPRYVAPDDAAGLASAIAEVAADTALRQAMRDKGLRQAQQFSWETCARETLACYRSVL